MSEELLKPMRYGEHQDMTITPRVTPAVITFFFAYQGGQGCGEAVWDRKNMEWIMHRTTVDARTRDFLLAHYHIPCQPWQEAELRTFGYGPVLDEGKKG